MVKLENDTRVGDFSAAAAATLAFYTAFIALSAASHLAAKTPWPQALFLDAFRPASRAMLSVLIAPQALFSPITVAGLVSLLLLGIQGFCLVLLWPVVRGWGLKARLFYIMVCLVPVFGPLAADVLLKSLGDFDDTNRKGS